MLLMGKLDQEWSELLQMQMNTSRIPLMDSRCNVTSLPSDCRIRGTKSGEATSVKLQLHYAMYRLRFYSNSLTHVLSLSNSHNDVASIQKNRDDKSHRVIVALSANIKL